MGEVGGRRPPGFDLGNSPTQLVASDLAGRVLVQRTSAGTQGLVRAAGAARTLFAAAFVCAGATARALAALEQETVTFVLTGVDHRDGDEDRACADYIAALLDSGHVDPGPYLRRVWEADAARSFLTDGDPDFPVSDVAHATTLDAAPIALRAQVEDGATVLRADRGTPSGAR